MWRTVYAGSGFNWQRLAEYVEQRRAGRLPRTTLCTVSCTTLCPTLIDATIEQQLRSIASSAMAPLFVPRHSSDETLT